MLLKSAMLLSAVLLVGAGLGRFWLLEPLSRGAGSAGTANHGSRTALPAITTMALTGLSALILLSVLDLRSALLNVIPSADLALTWRYALTSGHGAAVQLRIALAAALAALTVLAPMTGRSAWPAFVAAAIGVFGSFSVISHGAVMGGWWPLVTDLVHFCAAGAWSGTVFVLLVGRRWESWPRPALVAAMRKLSGLGLVAVATLAVTGVVSSLVHAGDPARFVGSEYATALVVKLAVVIVIVGLAAFNRFRFLPALVASGQLAPLRLAMRAEAVLLLAVLGATGWLSTTAVPHGSETSVDALENGRRMIEYLRR